MRGYGRNISIFIFIAILFQVSVVFAQEYHKPLKEKRKYYTQRLQGNAPEIDGVIKDDCWLEQGEWATRFQQFMPDNYAKPTRETEFKILYDDLNIYVAIRCFDDLDSIDIQGARRDQFRGDIVGIGFDSYHDMRSSFEFDLTAAGSKIDLTIHDKDYHTNWDPVWYGDVAFEDSAWTVEMRIPFSQLRFSDAHDQVWGMHIWRWINRNKEEDQWNVFAINTPSWVDNYGELHGISGLNKIRRIELMPYGLTSGNFYPKEEGNPFADGKDFKYNIGFDGKVGLSNNFTMDFTVNPDFGQVEADPSVLNLTAFETFYDEKRPFFLEGKTIFDFAVGGNQLFYSRRIGHQPSYSADLTGNQHANEPEETTILNALKITGKTKNGLSVGVIQSITPKETAEIDDNGNRSKQTVEPWSNYFLARVLKDYNKGNSSIGAMFTSTQRFIADEDVHLNSLATDAFTGGIDYLQRWKNRTYYLDVKTIFSQIQGEPEAILALQRNSRHYFQRPDIDHIELDTTRTSLGGFGGSIGVGKGGLGRWQYSENISWLSPGLDLNDLGYLRMTDVVSQNTELAYVVQTPTSLYRTYSVTVDQSNEWGFDGSLIMSSYEFKNSWTFKNYWKFNAYLSRVPQWQDTRLLRGGPALTLDGYWYYSAGIQSDSRKKFSYTLHSSVTKVDDDITSLFSLNPGVTLRVGNRFNMSGELTYSHNIDDTQYISTINFNDVNRYVLGRIDHDTWEMTLRANYAFTPNLILQYYVSPYISAGSFSHIKYVKDADADEYDDRFYTFSDEETVIDADNNTMAFDETHDGNADYSIGHPNFNFFEMRSNMVLRWEFTPGSTFYFVWTHGRSDYIHEPVRSLGKNADRLFSVEPQNVFMMKLNYWFSI